ncbi:hypothetical protein ACIBO6_28925 [Streptomyces luteogriseus]|uniref:hypothetical protein n=1 Tax=Streptomyces luteogriseus TaxID=68233 RepID=UPI0037A36098
MPRLRRRSENWLPAWVRAPPPRLRRRSENWLSAWGASTTEWATGHGPMYSRPADLATYLDAIATGR